jgi:hypothetical protein
MSNLSLATSNALDIHPVTGRIGAEIRGVRLSSQLDPATVEAIRAALVRHKVIFSAARRICRTPIRKPSPGCSGSRSRTPEGRRAGQCRRPPQLHAQRAAESGGKGGLRFSRYSATSCSGAVVSR